MHHISSNQIVGSLNIESTALFLSPSGSNNSFPIHLSDLTPPTPCPTLHSFSLNELFVFVAYASYIFFHATPFTWNSPLIHQLSVLKSLFKSHFISEVYLRSPIHPPVLFIEWTRQMKHCEAQIWNVFVITLLWGSPYSAHQKERESWQALQFEGRTLDVSATKGNAQSRGI